MNTSFELGMNIEKDFIPLCVPHVAGNEWKYIKDCLDSNWVSSAGPYVDQFEQDMADALADGSIASFTAREPTPAIAQVTTNAEIMMSYGGISVSPVLIHTTREYAQSHQKELVAFLHGQLDKVVLINSYVDEALKIATEVASTYGYDISPEIFKVIFERVDFSLEVDDDVIASLIDTALFLKNTKTIDEIPEFYVDSSFLEEAILSHKKN